MSQVNSPYALGRVAGSMVIVLGLVYGEAADAVGKML